MPTIFEAKVQQPLAEIGLIMQTLATHTSLLEPELQTLWRRGDLRLSEVEKLVQALRVGPTYFLHGSFLQAVISVCHFALEASRGLVAAKDAVIASEEEIIGLLRGRYNLSD
jgi:hypothetical protein